MRPIMESGIAEPVGLIRSASPAGEAIHERIITATVRHSMRGAAGAWQGTGHAIDPIVMEFDHVVPGKITDVSTMVRDGSPIVKIQREIAKCVVRCANCHRRKTAREFWGRTGVYPRVADISLLVAYGGCSSVG